MHMEGVSYASVEDRSRPDILLHDLSSVGPVFDDGWKFLCSSGIECLNFSPIMLNWISQEDTGLIGVQTAQLSVASRYGDVDAGSWIDMASEKYLVRQAVVIWFLETLYGLSFSSFVDWSHHGRRYICAEAILGHDACKRLTDAGLFPVELCPNDTRAAGSGLENALLGASMISLRSALFLNGARADAKLCADGRV